MNTYKYKKRQRYEARRGRKELRRRRQNKLHKDIYLEMQKKQIKVDRIITSKFSSMFGRLLAKHGLKGAYFGKADNRIRIPYTFSLAKDYSSALKCLRHSIPCMLQNVGGEIIYDFSSCKEVDQAALFFLQVIRMEINSELKKLQNRLSALVVKPRIRVEKSKSEGVNKHLVLCGFLSPTELEDLGKGMQPIHTMGYVKGSKAQAHYIENLKGKITTKVSDYVNTCLGHHRLELTAEGRNNLERLVSEMLNNAEDHSPTNTYYLTANFARELPFDYEADSDAVGMLNLSIMNIGYSIAKGFEDTKDDNEDLYDKMITGFNNLTMLPNCTFTRENIFTLYALQDGVSRLKYQDESRGTGTMTFINAFFAIGDYEDPYKEYKPQLNIYSGSTLLTCDNKYRPIEEGGSYRMALNDEQDLTKLPCRKHLRNLPNPFPGTLLSASFYLNESHLNEKFSSNASHNK